MRAVALTVFLALAGMVLYAAQAMDGSAQEQALSPLPTEELSVVTGHGYHRFDVEVVREGEALQRGLMFRKDLPKDTGMLFDFGRERRVSMWMKNTLISLDMLFINRSGTIVDIAEHTVPHSVQAIVSKRPALAVLEIPAGTSNHYGIRIGDRVEHPVFHP